MALTGYIRACGVQSGGGKNVWLAEVASVTSFTLVDPAYTAVTMNAAAIFKNYQFDPDTMEVKENVAVTNGCIAVTHTIDFSLARMSSAARAAVSEIALASSCGLIAIVEDNNGDKRVLGYSENHLKLRPMLLKTAVGGTGKKLGDANAWVITLESENNEVSRIYTGVVPIV